MDPLIAALLVLLLLGGGTALGLWLRHAQGRVRTVHGEQAALPGDLAPSEHLGQRATLLLFSSDYCSACPGTLRELHRHAGDGIRVHEINLSRHLGLARRERILQTPTVYLLDGRGRLQSRISGAPSPERLSTALEQLLNGAAHGR